MGKSKALASLSVLMMIVLSSCGNKEEPITPRTINRTSITQNEIALSNTGAIPNQTGDIQASTGATGQDSSGVISNGWVEGNSWKITTDSWTAEKERQLWEENNPLSVFDIESSNIEAGIKDQYRKFLQEISQNYTSFETENSIHHLKNIRDLYPLDAGIILKNSDMVSVLFKAKLLPEFKTLKVGAKTYFVTYLFIPIGESAEKTKNGNIVCGQVSVFGGTYGWPCVFIDSANGKIVSVPDHPLGEISVTRNSYVLSKTWDGDSCWSGKQFELFDENMKSISNISESINQCWGTDFIFRKGDIGIQFVSEPIDQEPISQTGSENGLFSEIRYLEKAADKNNPHYMATRKILAYPKWSRFRFDPVENMLNGSIFTFEVDTKKITLDFKKEALVADMGYSDWVFSVKKDGDWYVLEGRKSTFADSSLTTTIQIQSCKDNGSEYDPKPYTIKSLRKDTDSWDQIFSYKISAEKFGNKCTIPYKIIRTVQSGKSSTKLVEIRFPE